MTKYTCGYESFLRCLGYAGLAAVLLFIGMGILTIIGGRG